MAAGRLSFTFGFSGPAVSIDTACSSALVGAHQATAHLQRQGGNALSAGVNLMLSERTTAAAQAAGELAACHGTPELCAGMEMQAVAVHSAACTLLPFPPLRRHAGS